MCWALLVPTAFSTAIVGAVGVLIMLVGGQAIFAGRMTLGDLIMYTFFVGLLAAPVVQIAQIGTQVSEAFAGLDRIREILDLPTEDQEDASRAGLPVLAGQVAFQDVEFEYDPGTPVLRGISFQVPAGSPILLGIAGSLVGHDFFVFTNVDSTETNVVYRRRDGHYGLIEPLR